MFQNPVFLALVAAFGFGGWPLVARAAGIPPFGIAVILSIGTVAAVTAVGPIMFTWDAVSRRMIYIGLIAGVINGISFLAYSRLVSNPAWDISTYVPLAIALMLIVPVVGGPLFFGERLTGNKILGVIAILIGVYLIR
jgi:drug/metabolite transporter (DMT)-like permease